MKLRGIKKISIAISVLCSVVLLGCTEDRPYEEIFKDDQTETAKSLLLGGGENSTKNISLTNPDGVLAVISGDDWLYVPSTVNITRSTSATIPHYMGQARKVKLAFTKNKLKIIQLDKDDRFQENIANHKTVLSIPISHIDYKCAEDSNGKCTNKEIANSEITWDQKRYFQLKVKDMAQVAINFLPMDFNNLFYPCHSEVGSEFKDYQVEANAINIQVSKTFKSNLRCAGNIETLDDLTFTVDYHYSLVRMNSIKDPSYQPLEYTKTDENNFGFFTTHLHKIDVDNSDIEGSEKFLFNRWSPNKNITFKLSSNFAKPKFAKIRQATQKAINSINASLNKAGSKIQIIIDDKFVDNPGDIRNNSIVLVDDPQASGIIGYGPSTTNPDTGEIVHARTVMFLGTMKKFIKLNYEEMLNEYLKGQAKSNNQILTIAPQLLSQGKPNKLVEQLKLAKAGQLTLPNENPDSNTPSSIKQDILKESLHHHATHPRLNSTGSSLIKKRVEFLTQIHAYPEELFNFNAAFKAELKELIEKLNAKPWLELTTVEKTMVIDTLLPHVWVPTLVHELGHNLGLRHNFAGSEDKDNFYSSEELAEMGIEAEVKYSSVMDYAYKSTNELPIMGKYDIAALRYGYAEKVELKDGSLVSLSQYRSTPSEFEIKSYGFCTDEHVGANPNCNRFDEGTNMTEIALHYINAYEERYKLRNTRYKRRNFSLYSDPSYIYGLYRAFSGLRMLYERYESIKNSYNLSHSDPLWEELEFLKDLKQSTVISAGFFVDVINTPDTLCAVAMTSNPSQIIAALPIRDLSSFAVSCFDNQEIRLNEQYLIVAEGGKSFQSRKDPRNPNAYVDQIDVRGIWADKLVALEMLTAGSLGSPLMDKFTDNYLSIPEVAPSVFQAINNIMSDEIVGPVTFKNSKGVPLISGNLNINLHADGDAQNSHRIMKPLHPYAAKMLGLPAAETTFQKQAIKAVASNLMQHEHKRENLLMLNNMKVLTAIPQDGTTEADLTSVTFNGSKFFVKSNNIVVAQIMKSLGVVQFLDQQDPEKIKQALAELSPAEPNSESANSSPPTDPTVEEIKKLGAQALEKYLGGGFKSQDYYENIIVALSKI